MLHHVQDTLFQILAVSQPVNAQAMTHTVTNLHLGIERSVGILENDLHPASKTAHFFRTEGCEVRAIEHDLSICRLQQTQHQSSSRCLATAALSHQAEHFTLANIEINAIHGTNKILLLGSKRLEKTGLHGEPATQPVHLYNVLRHVALSTHRLLIQPTRGPMTRPHFFDRWILLRTFVHHVLATRVETTARRWVDKIRRSPFHDP